MSWGQIQYFKPSEFDSPDAPGSGLKMNLEFMHRLDHVRFLCGFPLKVTAGYRTAAHNNKIKGAKASMHLKGEAADIACTDVEKRYAIVEAAMRAGIRCIEVCDRHIHLDNRRDKSRLWTDTSK